MAEDTKTPLHTAYTGLSEMIASKIAEPIFPVKAVAGCICVAAIILYLPLGVIMFGGFLYLHLILRIPAGAISSADSGKQEVLCAPIDGQIIYYGSTDTGHFVVFRPQFFDSHIIYSPVAGELGQHIHFSGRFDKIEKNAGRFDVPEQNMRHEYSIELASEHILRLDIIATPLNRLITSFVDEGMMLDRREPLAASILRPVIIMHVPQSYQLDCRVLQRCVGGDTPIARLS